MWDSWEYEASDSSEYEAWDSSEYETWQRVASMRTAKGWRVALEHILLLSLARQTPTYTGLDQGCNSKLPNRGPERAWGGGW